MQPEKKELFSEFNYNNPMSRLAAQQRVQQENPQIDVYSRAEPTAASLQAIPGLNFATKNFGAYMPDSDAHEKARDFYETLDAVGAVTPAPGAAGAVLRTAPVSDREIDLVRAAKEATLKLKNDQYWTSQIDPALPWTLTEVTKVRPDILEKRLNAIKQLSQYTLDYEILRHLGHGGDPRLAELQYMIDQGMMSHMPVSTLVDDDAIGQFKASSFSIWNAFTPGTDSGANGGKFADRRLNLARTGIDPRYTRLGANARPHIISGNRNISDIFREMAPAAAAAPVP